MNDWHPRDFIGHIGVARRDITPPTGIYTGNWAAAKGHIAQGIHRPLSATVLTLQENERTNPLVLIAVDLGWWKNPWDERLIRHALLSALALDEARLMIGLSHTHAGPAICIDDAHQPGGQFIKPYLDHVAAQLLAATRRAVDTAQGACLHWRYGQCNLAAVRDLPALGAPQRMLVGYNPQVAPDTTLLVGRVTRQADGVVVATIVNYACHPTTLAWDNALVSPDYVGAMRELVEAATNRAPCLFLQGASGDLAPAEQYTDDVAVADRHGRQLGHAVLSQLEAMGPPEMELAYTGALESGASLALWRRKPAPGRGLLAAECRAVTLPLKKLPAVAELAATLAHCADPVQAERLRRKLHIVRAVGDGPTYHLPFWIWRVGDALIIGQPSEAYSLFQRCLRTRFVERPVVVANLVNGSNGYLVPADRCHDGLYAFWSSVFDTGAFERLLDRCLVEAAALLDRSGPVTHAAAPPALLPCHGDNQEPAPPAQFAPTRRTTN